MKIAIGLVLIMGFSSLCAAELKVIDVWNLDGSAKKMGTQILEQRIMVYEWERENAEYMLNNIGRKCSELKNIPEYTQIFALHSFDSQKKFGPDDICFSSESLRQAYLTLGDYNKWFLAERDYYENRPDKEDPYVMVDWLSKLITSGRYKEAKKFFPACVNSLYPWYEKKDVEGRLQKGEKIPSELSISMMSEPWDWVLEIKDKPDDLKAPYEADKKTELPERMHRYFYSNNATEKAAALDYYREKRIKFMIEKARRTWSGDLKIKADKYFDELQKTTTAQ